MSSTNTVYLITGANRGLGLGLLKALISRPSTTVIATARNAQSLSELLSECEDLSPGPGSLLRSLVLDLSHLPSPAAILESISKATNASVDRLDVLINNAGHVPPLCAALDTSPEDMRDAFEVNAIAPLAIFQALWPLLKKSANPKVIMITSSVGSIAAQEPLPGGAYGPSKAALNWIARSLHLQHENDNLVSIALHPGWVQTRSGDFAAEEWKYEAGPPVTVEESVEGMLRVIDQATRATTSGQFVTYEGEVVPW